MASGEVEVHPGPSFTVSRLSVLVLDWMVKPDLAFVWVQYPQHQSGIRCFQFSERMNLPEPVV